MLFQVLQRRPVVLAIVSMIVALGAAAAVAHLVQADLAQQNRLINVSARGVAGPGPDALLVGFVVSEKPQTLVVRGLGPSLANAGGPAALSDIVLRVVRHSDGVDAGRNEQWRTPGNERLLGDLRHLAPANPRDTACVLTLEPGGYSALVETRNGQKGLASIEIFVVKR